MNKYTEGLQKVGDRYRIYENVQVTKKDLVEVPIKEGTLVEGVGDKKLIKSYRFRVWEGGGAKNLNKRNYESVFDKVLNEKIVTLGGVNHPSGDEDLDPARVFSVQKNPLIEDGWLTVQVDLVGEYGQLVEDILEAGGPIGMSSSCLGRVSESGQIMPDSFTLERYSDWVISPSNNHQHFKSEMQETTKTVVKENSTIIVEDTNIENIKETNKTMTNEIKNLRLNLKTMIREAEKAVTSKEKLELLEEAFTYCEGAEFEDLKESINKKVETINEAILTRANKADELEKVIKTKETEVNSVKESVVTKEVEVSKLKAITESIKTAFNRNKLILEKQTELKEESESKLAIVERDLSEVLEKSLILESSLEEALALIVTEKEKMTPEEVKANFIKNVVNKGKDSKDDEKDDKTKDTPKAEKDKTDDEKAEDKKKKDEEDKKKESVNPKVETFYMDALKVDETIQESKETILACKTLEEAQKIVLDIFNKVPTKVTESVHDKVDAKISNTKSVSSITEKYRANWGL